MSGRHDSNLPGVRVDTTADQPPKSLRDEFAMAALTGMLANASVTRTEDSADSAVEAAYRCADRMLETRRA